MFKNRPHKIDHPVSRIVFLCLGLVTMAFGVAFSIKGALGTSPISSVPYVTAEISGLSVGTTTIIMNFMFVLIQIAILRKQTVALPGEKNDKHASLLPQYNTDDEASIEPCKIIMPKIDTKQLFRGCRPCRIRYGVYAPFQIGHS